MTDLTVRSRSRLTGRLGAGSSSETARSLRATASGSTATAAIPAAEMREPGQQRRRDQPPNGTPVCRRPRAKPRRCLGKASSTRRPPGGRRGGTRGARHDQQHDQRRERRRDCQRDDRARREAAADEHATLADPVGGDTGCVRAECPSDRERGDGQARSRGGQAQVCLDGSSSPGSPARPPRSRSARSARRRAGATPRASPTPGPERPRPAPTARRREERRRPRSPLPRSPRAAGRARSAPRGPRAPRPRPARRDRGPAPAGSTAPSRWRR